jgi:hypothetical protein
MIEDHIEIVPRTIVRHDEGSIDYETTRQLAGKIIEYTQLEDGQFPPGTQYGKDEAGFRHHFTIISLPTKSVVREVLDELRDL